MLQNKQPSESPLVTAHNARATCGSMSIAPKSLDPGHLLTLYSLFLHSSVVLTSTENDTPCFVHLKLSSHTFDNSSNLIPQFIPVNKNTGSNAWRGSTDGVKMKGRACSITCSVVTGPAYFDMRRSDDSFHKYILREFDMYNFLIKGSQLLAIHHLVVPEPISRSCAVPHRKSNKVR